MKFALLILADTHINKQIAIQLRDKGVDVVRLEELADLPNYATDRQILEYAASHHRAVLSLDDDFRTLHYEWLEQNKVHSGIFLGNRRLQGNIGIIVTFIIEQAELIEAMVLIENDLIEFG
ncbi:MAG: DUF5615 family PIN-like protein [Phototrophicaceae bacterium]